ncbi:MAG: TetR/AcrR family transcriptional regulator [Solirubrobacterales bacterium]
MTPTATTPARGRRAKRPSGDEREQAIRETLEKLLETKQFHEISIDDLARGAGISRPSFYFYFESKEAALLALLDEIVGQADAVSDVSQAMIDADPRKFLRDSLAAYVTILGAHRGVMVAGSQAAVTSPEVRKLWSRVRERWVQMGADGIAAERRRVGITGALAPRELSIALLNMNEGVMNSMFAGEEPSVPEERVIDVLSGVWVNAVYEGPAPEGS